MTGLHDMTCTFEGYMSTFHFYSNSALKTVTCLNYCLQRKSSHHGLTHNFAGLLPWPRGTMFGMKPLQQSSHATLLLRFWKEIQQLTTNLFVYSYSDIHISACLHLFWFSPFQRTHSNKDAFSLCCSACVHEKEIPTCHELSWSLYLIFLISLHKS